MPDHNGKTEEPRSRKHNFNGLGERAISRPQASRRTALGVVATLSPTSRILVKELQRLAALLGRAAAPTDVIAAVRGDPEHALWPLFRGLAHANDAAWAARLAWLVNCIRLEQGLPLPADIEAKRQAAWPA